MAFRMSHDGLRRPSREVSKPISFLEFVVLMAVLGACLIALDVWSTDGRYIKFLLTDGLRPFRTMFDGLHVKGL